MNLSTGIDLVEIERIRGAIGRHGDRFIRRVYTAGEQRECGGRAASLAARFAAKEAAAKALGCGIGEIGWLDIEVLGDDNHAPRLILHGHAVRVARERGLIQWAVSLSHSRDQAVAVVVAMG